MTQRSNSAPDKPIVAPDRAREAIVAIFSAGRARNVTRESVANLSGVNIETIKGWVGDGKEASLSRALSVACVLGAPAVNHILSLIGYGGARPLDEPETLNLGTLTAHLIAGVSVLANAAADGRIDHLEEGPCREAADMIIAEVLPLSSSARAS